MNTAQQAFTPQTIWYGGRPACLPPMTPKPKRAEKQVKVKPTRNGPTMKCLHCSAVFQKLTKQSAAEFKRRKYCSYACGLTAKEIVRTARQDAVLALLPATISDMMRGANMTYAETERIIRLLVIAKRIVSEPNGRHPRIYRRIGS